MALRRVRRVRRARFTGRVAREGGAATLSDAWRTWVAENLLLGLPAETLLRTLQASGAPRAIAAREIDAIRRSPLLAGAGRVARLALAHEKVARMRRECEKVASRPTAVPRRSGVTPEEFFDRHYARGEPLVLTDAMHPWPALSRWSPAHLAERVGDAIVEVMTGRDANPRCDSNFGPHQRAMLLADFCDAIVKAGSTNDLYMVANNFALRRPELAPLLEDVRAPHPYLDDARDGTWISLWLGPAGTLTPLHYDRSNNLLCQVFGQKRILLFPSFELALLRNVRDGYFSSLDPENPDLDRLPEFPELARREVVLAAGEALFIPVGWWHHVRSLEVSITLSFTNFRAPNRYDWFIPGWRG